MSKTKTPGPPKQRSRLLYLVLSAAMIWAGTLFYNEPGITPLLKMFGGEILWALISFTLIGFFFVYKPAKNIAGLALIASLGNGVGQLYHGALADLVLHMPLIAVILMAISVLCYAIGIAAGLLVDWLLKHIARLIRPELKPAHI